MKQIPLSQGKFTIVDNSDFEYLNQFKWYCNARGYVVRNKPTINGKRGTIWMHREIIQTPQEKETDHINHNKLDNRKRNLRICTRSQNMMNTRSLQLTKSGVRGITYRKTRDAWEVRICINKNRIFIGYFKNLLEAKLARKNAEDMYYKEFSLNFAI